MNAAIRAVVRTGLAKGRQVYGIRQDYAGLGEDRMIELATHDVGGIIQRGGTMPGSARCAAFRTKEGRKRGIRNPVNPGFPVNLRTKR